MAGAVTFATAADSSLKKSLSFLASYDSGTDADSAKGDKRLFNHYGIILVNPKRHPHVKVKEAQAFIDWVLGAEGQAAIGAYRIEGRQAFFPTAGG